jgi:PAS domain-containing protein
MNLREINGNAPPAVDLGERRLLFDASWPMVLIILTAAYLASWYLGLLTIDLPAVLWTTFGVAVAHQVLSRLLDYVDARNGVLLMHTTINVAAITGLAVIWSMLGGLAAPAFAIFFALPIIALGLVARLPVQFAVTVYAIVIAWLVAIRESADLRLQLDQLGFPPFWHSLPALTAHEFVGYGVTAGGAAQLQFMIVFSFAMLGVVTTSAIVIALVSRLFNRLRFVSASDQRAQSMAQSFLTQTDGLEMIIDRQSFQVIAVSPRLAEELEEAPEVLVGCHYTAVLPFPYDHPAIRLIDAGISSHLPHQVFPAASGYKLVNFRIHPGTSDGYEFQRVTLEDLQENDYAQITVDGLNDLSGVVDGGGRILYLSKAVKKLLPVSKNQWRADLLPLPAGWWQIGARKQHTRTVAIGRTDYRLELSRDSFYAEDGDMEVTVFRLHAMQRG